MTVEPPGAVDDQDGDAEAGDDASLASVVLIDRREDIAGICGRVDTAPTFAVVLHVPRGNRQLSTELGMRRLQRHVEDSGKVIAVATGNAALAARARQVGIPVARKPEHVRWDSGGRRVMRVGHSTWRLPVLGRYVQVAVLLAVALFFLVAAATVAPSATLTVYPASETVSRTVTLTASPDAAAIDFDSLTVPSTKVSAQQRMTLAQKTTGTVSVGTVPAKATLRITNPTASDMDVPASAVVIGGTAADPVQFALDNGVTVPAGGSVSVSATALRLGGAGNLGPNLISAWADPKYKALAVANPAASAGGQNEDRPAIAAGDLVAIRDLANQLQKSDTVKDILASSRPHDAVFLTTAETKVDFPDPAPSAGTPADIILMNVDVTVTAYAVLEDTLDKVASHLLSADQGSGQLLQGTITATETGARQVDASTGTIRTEVNIRGQFVRDISADKLKDAVKGKSPDDARSTLNTMYGIQDANVSLSPGWAPWLPRFSFRIGVDLKNKPADDSTKGATSDDAAQASTGQPTAAAATARP